MRNTQEKSERSFALFLAKNKNLDLNNGPNFYFKLFIAFKLNFAYKFKDKINFKNLF